MNGKMEEEIMSKLFEGLENILEEAGVSADCENGAIKDNMDAICEMLESEIIKGDSDEETKKDLLKKLRKFCNTQTNIMLVGATGCGKSSTINALFGCKGQETGEIDLSECINYAKVGTKSDPETKDIEKFTLGNLILWDTPGLGDSTEMDEHHKTLIQDLLKEKDKEGNALIDLVLVILDGSTRDLGTSYKILNDVIIPELGEDTGRILVALNQADIAMKTGRHWDYEKNEPDEVLVKFLEEKVESIKERIKTDSGLEIEPVYYCAGYKESKGDVVYPYNLSKLLYYILSAMPSHKRVAVMESVAADAENYEHNDDDMDYGEAVKSSFMESIDPFISEGVDTGADIGGAILGIPGAIVGAFIGGAVGCIRSILDEIF